MDEVQADKPKNKGGRPHKQIDEKVFRSLCRIQCTQEEICMILDTTDKTLDSWCKRTFKTGFSDTYKLFSADGKMSLRRAMYEKAVKDGNTAMMIWLSKQYLGMQESVQVDQTELLHKLDSVLNGVKDAVDKEADAVQ